MNVLCKRKKFIILLTGLMLLVPALRGWSTTYYVDSTSGNDTYSGTSTSAAWQTLSKVSTTTFSAGDSILLKCGCSWDGQLWPQGSGSSGSPISINCYGDPNNGLPLINGVGAGSAVYLYNQEYWDVNNLEITNYSANDDPDEPNGYFRRGVGIIAEDYGQANHFHLYNLVVHDVSGSYQKKDGGGIFFEVRGSITPTYFDDFIIDGCYIYDVNRTGISNNTANSKWWRTYLNDANWYPTTNYAIRNCVVERAAFNGGIPRSSDGMVVEYCTFKDNGRYGNGNALFIFNTDNTTFQYCEGYGTIWVPGTNDAAGFDSDGRNKYSRIQYCYSHDNGQGGIVMAVGDGMTPEQRYNIDARIRYNVIEDCERQLFRLSGPPTGAKFHNNTIYLGSNISDVMIIYIKSWNGVPDNTSYLNNIFYNLASNCTYYMSSSTNNHFDSNVFYGNHPANEPADANKLTNDPLFVNPGSGGVGMDSVDGYKLQDSSPCIDTGIVIDVNNGGFDYWGNTVPYNNGTPDRGAYEAQVEGNVGETYTLNPEADSYVRGGSYNSTNYGTSTVLDVRDSTDAYTRKPYLRFDLSSVTGTVTSAKLRLKVNSESGDSTHNVNFVSDDTWGESTITWLNAPSAGAQLGSSQTVPGVGEWTEFDVNDQVAAEFAGDGKISLLVSETGTSILVAYYSKEAASGNRPQLIIHTAVTGGPNLPGKATSPSPSNSATNVAITTDLSWTADANATSHDVYFGTTSPGDSKGNQGGTTYDPGTMDANTTYYWRIDEVSSVGTTTGDVWSFTTLPLPGVASNPSPVNSETEVSITEDLSWTAGSDATSHDVYFGTSSPGSFQGNQTGTTFDPGTMDANATYYWRIDEKNSSGTTTGTVWSFSTELKLPGQATNPSPANNATDVSITADLSWTADANATSHDVYFGTSSPGAFQGNQTGTTFDTGTMDANTAYYWRIDEKNGSGTATGTVWSFTTEATSAGGEYTLNPEADSYVRGGSYNSTNYGTSTVLDVKTSTSSYTRKAYLRFDLSSVSGTVTSATLRLRVNSREGSATHDVNFVSDDAWNESTITWLSAPSDGVKLGSSQAAATEGNWTEFDVTDQVGTETAGDGKVSFVVSDSSSGALVHYDSREAATSENRPQLVVQTGGGGGPQLPGKATNPSPANTATGVSLTADLSWTADANATSHDVYFGTSSPGSFQGNQTGATFDPGTMDANTTYYWRIDEVSGAGTTTGDVWSFTTTVGGGGEYTLNPEADSYVRDGSYNATNYGTTTSLAVKQHTSSGYTRWSFLRFDLSSVSGTVTSATLRLKVSGRDGSAVHEVNFVSDDAWNESTITWNNKPSVGTALDTDVSTPDVDEWIEFDVTSQVGTEVAGDDEISLAVMSTSGTNLTEYYSKDYGTSADRPQLVITSE